MSVCLNFEKDFKSPHDHCHHRCVLSDRLDRHRSVRGISWAGICDPATKVLLGLSFSTSEQVEKEFYTVIDRIAKNHKNPKKYALAIKDRAKPYFDSVFHIRDSKPTPKFKFENDTNADEILDKYNLKPDKDRGDAKIISCVVNYLRFLGGSSLPHVVTSD